MRRRDVFVLAILGTSLVLTSGSEACAQQRRSAPMPAPAIAPAPAPSQRLLGVYGQTVRFSTGYEAVQVTSVIANSPALDLRRNGDAVTKYVMVPGRDYISEVDGQRVRTMDELRAAIQNASFQVELRVYDAHDGSHDYYTANLGNTQGEFVVRPRPINRPEYDNRFNRNDVRAAPTGP